MRLWILIGAILASMTSVVFAQGTFNPGGGSGAASYVPDLASTSDTLALWQFEGDRLDSGSGGYDLTIVNGNARYSRVRGNLGVRCATSATDGSGYEHFTATDGGALALTGAMTISAILLIEQEYPSNDAAVVTYDGGAAETESQNYLYSVQFNVASQRVQYSSENGAGTNSNASPSVRVYAPGQMFILHMVRDATGDISFYLNGVQHGDTLSTTLPTGGGSSTINVCNSNTGLTGDRADGLNIFSLRIEDAEMSASAVLAEAQLVGLAP